MGSESLSFSYCIVCLSFFSNRQLYETRKLILFLQVYVDTLVKKAYENWNQVIEYDGKSLLSFKQSKRPGTSRNELQMLQNSYASDDQLQLPPLPALPSDQSLVNVAQPVAGELFALFSESNCFG